MLVGFVAEVSGAATAVGVLVAAVALLMQRGQSRTTFEDDLVRQYREIVKPKLVTAAVLDDVSETDAELLSPFYQYIDLCNEQVFLRLSGRVRRRTWDQWADGIKVNLARPAVASAWDTIKEKAPTDFQELRLLESCEYRDPRSWFSRPRRFWCWIKRKDPPLEEARKRLARPSITLPSLGG